MKTMSQNKVRTTIAAKRSKEIAYNHRVITAAWKRGQRNRAEDEASRTVAALTPTDIVNTKDGAVIDAWHAGYMGGPSPADKGSA